MFDIDSTIPGLKEFEAYLKSQGFTDTDMIGGICPFQLQGSHYKGISFYFRARDNWVTLFLYHSFIPLDDFDEWVELYYRYPKNHQAGWIDFEEAFYYFYHLWNDVKDFVLER